MSQKLIQVAPGKVKILSNARTVVDKTGLADLAKSIKENGLIQPILVRKRKNGTYELIAGQRRLLASRLAKIPLISAIENGYGDKDITAIQTIENVEREALTVLQEAAAYVKMIDSDALTVKEVSDRMHKTAKEVRLMLNYRTMIKPIEEGVLSGNYNPIPALVVAGFPKEIQKDVNDNHDDLLRSKKNVAEILQLLEIRYFGDLNNAGFDTESTVLNAKAGACTGCKYNTALTETLFDSGVKRCMNIPCYMSKRKVTLDALIKELTETKKRFHLIATLYSSAKKYGDLEILGRDDYRLVKSLGKVEDLPKSIGIVIDGDSFGQFLDIVTTEDLKKVEKKKKEAILKAGNIEKINAVEGKTPDQRYLDNVARYDRKSNSIIMAKLMEVLIASKKVSLVFEDMKPILYLMYGEFDYSMQRRIKEFLGVEEHLYIDYAKFSKLFTSFDMFFIAVIKGAIPIVEEVSDNDGDLKLLSEICLKNLGNKTVKTIVDDTMKDLRASTDELKAKFVAKWGREPGKSKQVVPDPKSQKDQK